ncbi:hypothetical protein Phi4:1_gp003 [Cellulophaga phage phi4:1]|uniref:Uncharacterized protein n=5 Tax=Lightbulbvirus TaxID=1918522 RepID=A0A0S2MWA0_9CAUD|nr:hypothetical protein Phi4:1_gp003 [Cellulophaga phage phi4:1]YP_008241498.1 hypothetical protein Phi17:2_gp003 [Cellulophaga phage phi17:2]ALO80012.1 hypothetical protein Phi4113_003 [Cellulophaga phage phi4:1_13]ALO80209.1 hypothetical protein Phi4118_003 [Cellulophaga phage phi4:1_18]ALO80406.1 hypothetical protein Phi17218_003 [Cellulophaga phage phi17:2_18]AGO47536.1 hypothetical protein Phi17:2_gp003 [Cellulophaga phage phi17:2]AGO49416.1 hypothetical protein Phi4:1_gp003 [Cellulophag
MEQYKLKLRYPSLPMDWEIGMEIGIGDYSVDNSFSPVSITYTDMKIPYKEVKDNPEYWELIPEDIFEAIEYSDGYNKYYKTTSGVFTVNTTKMYNESRLLLNCFLTRVRRLSDGAIFSVGDTVFKNDNTLKKWTIESFIRKEKELIVYGGSLRYTENIKFLKVVEKTSFTSHDKVELDEKSEYYVVNDKFNFIQGGSPQTYPSFTKNKTKYYIFSCKLKAIAFIKFKKPCISTEDVKKACAKLKISSGTTYRIMTSLTESINL